MSIDKQIRELCGVLEGVASQFPKRSKEYKALKSAAFAYIFAMIHHRERFTEYLLSIRTPLTEREKKYLRKIGY